MSENIRMNKLLKFGAEVVRSQAKEKGFFSLTNFKDSDCINFIVSEWLRQNYTQKELFDLGYDDIFD